ncbi:MAG: DUF3307 domain-containing protein [Myxococcales bacterium]
MTGLYLLAAHLVGDFVLQSRRMAALKLDDARVRAEHVGCYLLPFYPLACWQSWHRPVWHGVGFLVGLGLLHYLTDSRRFRSTLMDWIEWRLDRTHIIRDEFGRLTKVRTRLKPNPWSPAPIILDQTLHVCQLAVLAGVMLA